MLRMESHHSDSSLNFSERDSPAWVKLWNANYNSSGGLNLGENGSDPDLTSAIGDKEVAAKAVAFVVNSTRKGIVPLCADVANLLRNKRSLEDKITQLTKENEALRQISDERLSLTGSTVTHNTQPSQDQDTTTHHSPPHNIDCSQQCSSCVSSSHSNSHHSAAAESAVIHDVCHKTSSEQTEEANNISEGADKGESSPPDTTAHSENSKEHSPPQHSFVPVAPAGSASPRADNEVIIHPIPSEDLPSSAKPNSVILAEVHITHQTSEESTKKPRRGRERRTPSLSSSEHGSNRSLELNANAEGLQSVLSEQLGKTVRANQKLSEELNAARATIEKLQCEVRDYRALYKNNNQDSCGDRTSLVWHSAPQRQHSAPDILPPHSSFHHTSSSTSNRDLPARAAILPSCQMCAEVQASSINGAMSSRLFKHDSLTLFTSENTLVNLEDSVLTSNNQCGTVRYIGHIDGFAPTCLFVGLQLSEKVAGGLDGTYNGKKYFSCPKGRGIFVQAQDVVNIITKKQAAVLNKSKKSALSANIEESAASSSSSGSAAGLVSKLRKAVNLRHTNSHKRISLPTSPTSPLGPSSTQSSSSSAAAIASKEPKPSSSNAAVQSNAEPNNLTSSLNKTTTPGETSHARNTSGSSATGLPEGFV